MISNPSANYAINKSLISNNKSLISTVNNNLEFLSLLTMATM